MNCVIIPISHELMHLLLAFNEERLLLCDPTFNCTYLKRNRCVMASQLCATAYYVSNCHLLD